MGFDEHNEFRAGNRLNDTQNEVKMLTDIFFIQPTILKKTFYLWKEIWENYICSTYILVLFVIYIYLLRKYNNYQFLTLSYYHELHTNY